MSGTRKNPFEILGVTPEIAGRLGERDLFALVKSMYRTLLKVYHPDRQRSTDPKTIARDAARAVELNLAFESLNLDKDPESFRYYHRTYSGRINRGLRKKVAELENQLKAGRERQNLLSDRFMLYLLCGLPWQEAEELGRPCRLTAPANVKLGLNDVAINQNVRTASWSLGSNYKEIVFDALGSMYYRPVGRSKPFVVNFIHLLGVIGLGEIDLLPLLNRVPPRPGFFRCPALDSRYGIDGAPPAGPEHHVPGQVQGTLPPTPLSGPEGEGLPLFHSQTPFRKRGLRFT